MTAPGVRYAQQGFAHALSGSVLHHTPGTQPFQRVAKGTRSSGKTWEGFMPEETKADIAGQAEAIARTISEGRLDRALLAEIASFLHYPAMASTSRLAYLLKAFEAVLQAR